MPIPLASSDGLADLRGTRAPLLNKHVLYTLRNETLFLRQRLFATRSPSLDLFSQSQQRTISFSNQIERKGRWLWEKANLIFGAVHFSKQSWLPFRALQLVQPKSCLFHSRPLFAITTSGLENLNHSCWKKKLFDHLIEQSVVLHYGIFTLSS